MFVCFSGFNLFALFFIFTKNCFSELLLFEQFDDFDLDGAVEGGGRFVEEDELGPQDEGAGDGDALALSA